MHHPSSNEHVLGKAITPEALPDVSPNSSSSSLMADGSLILMKEGSEEEVSAEVPFPFKTASRKSSCASLSCESIIIQDAPSSSEIQLTDTLAQQHRKYLVDWASSFPINPNVLLPSWPANPFTLSDAYVKLTILSPLGIERCKCRLTILSTMQQSAKSLWLEFETPREEKRIIPQNCLTVVEFFINQNDNPSHRICIPSIFLHLIATRSFASADGSKYGLVRPENNKTNNGQWVLDFPLARFAASEGLPGTEMEAMQRLAEVSEEIQQGKFEEHFYNVMFFVSTPPVVPKLDIRSSKLASSLSDSVRCEQPEDKKRSQTYRTERKKRNKKSARFAESRKIDFRDRPATVQVESRRFSPAGPIFVEPVKALTARYHRGYTESLCRHAERALTARQYPVEGRRASVEHLGITAEYYSSASSHQGEWNKGPRERRRKSTTDEAEMPVAEEERYAQDVIHQGQQLSNRKPNNLVHRRVAADAAAFGSASTSASQTGMEHKKLEESENEQSSQRSSCCALLPIYYCCQITFWFCIPIQWIWNLGRAWFSG